MASRPIVEVAVDSVEAAEMAWTLGADRIELCQALEVGGLTPSPGLIDAVVTRARGPVFAMIRPRPGDFLVTADDLAVMVADVANSTASGCAGVVVGALLPNREIDGPSVARLVAAAGSLPITCHRAFDLSAKPMVAVARLIELGVKRVLTAGGAGTAFEGRKQIAKIVDRAGPRLTVIAGGGVTSDHVVELVRQTRVGEIHLSGSYQVRAGQSTGFGMNTVANPARLMRVIEAIDREFGRREHAT